MVLKSKTLESRRLNLLDECIRKEKLTSWEQLANTLEKPALKLRRMATEIKMKHVCLYSMQHSMESTASVSSVNSPTSPTQSLASSFSSATMEVSHGESLGCVCQAGGS